MATRGSFVAASFLKGSLEEEDRRVRKSFIKRRTKYLLNVSRCASRISLRSIILTRFKHDGQKKYTDQRTASRHCFKSVEC